VKNILFLIALLLAFFAFNLEVKAAPFVVSDPYPAASTQPDGFTCTVNAGPVVDSPADAVTPTTNRLKLDVADVPSGSNTLKCKAYKNDPVWGRLESAEAVFTFTRPASPSGPSGFKLLP